VPSVDDRIVSMKFDNRNFESQIESTIKSLNSLKESLKFTGVKTNLSELSRIDKGITLDSLSRAVDKVSEKFTLLNAVAFATISNITNKAINAGESLAKSLSLDQVMGGFREYSTNINAIQTVLANTKSQGTTLDDVNKALDQLNQYSDLTIYNFGQMVKNIGTFTAAGVDLQTSVNAIKGFSNVAAISGADANQAAMGMYQLSQALAQGTVRLIDWKSMISAGVGGEVFKKALFETGKAMKTLQGVSMTTTFDQWEKSAGNFQYTLEKGWLTADVMTTTLKAFTGDLNQEQLVALGYSKEQALQMMELGATAKQAATTVKTLSQLLSTLRESVASGWSASFRLIFGDFEEARNLFTGWYGALVAIVNKQAEARNKILGDWKALGGRAELIAGITILFHDLILAIKPIREAFRAIFPRKTGADLAALSVKFRELAQRLAMSEETAGKVRRIFKGVFAVFEIGFTIIKSIIKVVMSLFSAFSRVAGSPILDFLANFGDRLTALNNRLVSFGGIQKFFSKVVSAIQKAVEAFQVAIKFFKFGLDGVDIKFGESATWLDKFAFKAGQAFVKMGEFLSKAGEKLQKLGAAIANFFSTSYQKILDFFKGSSKSGDKANSTFDDTAKKFDLLATIGKALSKVWEGIIATLRSVKALFIGIASTIGETIATVFNSFGETLSGEGFASLLGAIAIGLFGFIRSFVRGGLVDLILGKGMSKSIRQIVDSAREALKALETDIKADALMRIAKAIAILAVALFVLSRLNGDQLRTSLVGAAIGLLLLLGVLKAFERVKLNENESPLKFVALASSMMIIAGALLFLSVALWALSKLSWEDILKGLALIVPLFAGLYFVLKEFTEKIDSKDVLGVGVAIWGLGSAILKFAKAVKVLSAIPEKQLKQGFRTLIFIMAALVAFVHALPKNLEKKLKGMFTFSLALRVIVSSIKSLGNMDPMKLLRGLEGLVAILTSLMITFVLLDKVDIRKVSESLLSFAAALLIISVAMSVIGGMKLGDWGKAIVGLVIILGALVGAVYLLDQIGEVNVANFLALGAGLLLISLAFRYLADLSIGNIFAGLLALGGALLIIVGAGYLAEAAAIGLLALGGAILMIGLGFALIGVGANQLAKAFKLVAEHGDKGIEVFKKFLKAAGSALPDLVSGFIKGIVDGIVDLAKTIAKEAPDLIDKFTKIAVQLLKSLRTIIPEAKKTLGVLIDNLLQLFTEKTPDIITAGFKFLLNLLNGLLENIDKITEVVANIIERFLTAFAKRIPGIARAGAKVVAAFLNGIADNIADVAKAATHLVVEFLNGITDNIDEIVKAGSDLIVAFIDSIADNLDDILKAGTNLIVTFINGIAESSSEITTAITNLIVTFINGVADNSQSIITAGTNLIVTLINGFSEASDEIITALAEFVVTIINGLAGHADEFITAGTNLILTVINGFGKSADEIITAVGNVINTIIMSLGGQAIALGDAGAQVITDVIDGFGEDIQSIIDAGTEFIGKFLEGVAKVPGNLVEACGDFIVNVCNGLAEAIRKKAPEIDKAIGNLVDALVEAFETALKGRVGGIAWKIGKTFGLDPLGILEKIWEVNSPSKVMIRLGESIGLGFRQGINGQTRVVAKSMNSFGETTLKTLSKSLSSAPSLDLLMDTNPVIAPVLDLSNIEKNSARLNSILNASTIKATISTDQAALLVKATQPLESTASTQQPTSTEIKFEQNVYSPTSLSVGELYRQTKNQITMAKEELSIL